MVTGSGLVTLTGILAIAGGVLVLVFGLVFLGLLFFGRGVPVGGAGFFLVFTLAGGPLLVILGSTIIFSGIRLMSGHAWARTCLTIICWLLLIGVIAWCVYNLATGKELEARDYVSALISFLLIGGPSIILLLLLRAEAVKQAMTR